MNKGKIAFIPPFGLCLQIIQYDKEISLKISHIPYKAKIENLQVFITDPERSSFSSINLHSHQGADIKGRRGCSPKSPGCGHSKIDKCS